MYDGVAGVLVTCKFSLTTLFIIGLAKWFSRVQLTLVFGLWFTNEAFAMLMNYFIIEDEYLYVISGVSMVILSVEIFKYYRIDPFDSNLLLNEQAINLTS